MPGLSDLLNIPSSKLQAILAKVTPSIPQAFQPGADVAPPDAGSVAPVVLPPAVKGDDTGLPSIFAQATQGTPAPSLKPQTGIFANVTPPAGEPYTPLTTGEKIGRVLQTIQPIAAELGAQAGTPSQKEFYLGQQRNQREAAQQKLEFDSKEADKAMRERQLANEELHNAASLFGETSEGGSVNYHGQPIRIPGTKEKTQQEIETYKARETAKSDIDAETKTKQAQDFVEKVYGIQKGDPNYVPSVLNVLGHEPLLDAGKYLGDKSLEGTMLPASKLISAKMGKERIVIQQQRANTAAEALQNKFSQLTPAAAKQMMDIAPAQDQIDDLLNKLEPLKTNNSNGYFFKDRAKYAFGIDSDGGDIEKSISQLELNRILAGSRLLKGGSRAYQALKLAMVHAPNTWIDSPQLMYNKLMTIKNALKQMEDAVYKYGTAGGGMQINPSNAPSRGKQTRKSAPVNTPSPGQGAIITEEDTPY